MPLGSTVEREDPLLLLGGGPLAFVFSRGSIELLGISEQIIIQLICRYESLDILASQYYVARCSHTTEADARQGSVHHILE